MNVFKLFAIFTVVVLLAAPAMATTLWYNHDTPALDHWTSISVSLTESNWLVDDSVNGQLATQADFQWVLSHLEGIYLLTEWKTGADDTNVDNIRWGTALTNTFDSDNAGWVTAGIPGNRTYDLSGTGIPTSALGHDVTFGNPAGSVRLPDVYAETYIGAPSGHLGNQSSRYGEVLSFDIYIRYTDGAAYPAVILVAPSYVGDLDEDGDVDGLDFLAWQRDPGVGALSEWQANYGAPSIAAVLNGVPEPNAGLLCAAMCLALARRNRRVCL